ncbi:MAG: CRR6 family NdhI maturation factor [Synechococcales cyanobacterium]
MTTIILTSEHLQTLNLAPVETLVLPWLEKAEILNHEQTLEFTIDYPRDPTDPRELSEIPEVRLWFVRLDARYPWFPFLLNWKTGELARYVAMVVPHQFHRQDGIQFNPEALELFVMGKLFILADWFKENGIEQPSRLQAIAQMLGYEVDNHFFTFLTL